MKKPVLTLSAAFITCLALPHSARAAIAVFAHTHWSGNGGGLPPTPPIWNNNAANAGRMVTALSQNLALQAGSGPNSAGAQVMAQADSNGVHARVQTSATATGNAAVISRAGNTAGTITQLFDANAGENGAGAMARLVGSGCIIGNTNVASFLTSMNFRLNGPVVGGRQFLSDNSVITIGIGVNVEQTFDGVNYTSLLNQTGSATASFGTNGAATYSNTVGLLASYAGQPGFPIKSPQFSLSTNMAHLMRITLTMAVAGMADPGVTGAAGNLVDFSHTFGFDPTVPVLDDLPNDLGGATFDAPDLNVLNNGFTPVPEPSGLVLLALGGMAALRRRSRS